MFQILIVDDNEKDLDRHKEYVQSQLCKNQIHANIFTTTFPNDISYDISYDVAFLDIDMPQTTGFSIASKLSSNNTRIVFITNREDLVYQSFQYQPFGYIRKSHFKEDFLTTFERLIPKLKNYIVIDFQGQPLRLSIHDILYAESFAHNLIIHTTQHEYEIRCKLVDFYELIHSQDFSIINQSYLVNFKHLKKLEDIDCYLDTGEILPISRRKVKDVKKQYYLYIFRSV